MLDKTRVRESGSVKGEKSLKGSRINMEHT